MLRVMLELMMPPAPFTPLPIVDAAAVVVITSAAAVPPEAVPLISPTLVLLMSMPSVVS